MIEFNKVTWYSRLLSLIFLLGVIPVLMFYIGRKYEETMNVLDVAEKTIKESIAIYQPSLPKEKVFPTRS